MTTPRPWPEGTRPTAAELLGYIRDTADGDDALPILDRLLEADQRAERCAVLDHDGAEAYLTHRLHAAILAGNRYRLAWTSARHRARILRAMTIRTANRNIELIAGIDTIEEGPR